MCLLQQEGGLIEANSTVQIVGSNRPATYPKGLFRMGWVNGRTSQVSIPQHASDRIVLASFEDEYGDHPPEGPPTVFEMHIWRLVEVQRQSQWWLRWLVEDKEELPYLELKVAVIAEGTRKPWIRYFMLTPKSRLGPLSLSLVEGAA